ncbi:ileal sodium/bile acid cotransporter-like [Glandiceps talaboti]
MADYDYSITIINETQNGTATAPPPNPLAVVNQVIITSSLVILMVGMGCTMTLSEVWRNLRRPTGIIIGACCQFILMPFLGWSLAHIVELSPEMAIGTIAIATCPGGAFSNVLTYWTRGDTVLSICMTTCSTIIGIGMMPLNLFIYTRSWADAAAVIPYIDIVIALAILIFPCALGMFILKKWPRVAEIVAKIASIITIGAIFIVICIVSIINPNIYLESWKPYVVVLLYPMMAFSLGYVIPWLCRQEHSRCRTIAFETGVQNGALALTIINLMISRGLDLTFIFAMMVVPSLHIVFVFAEFLGVCLVYRLYWKRKDAQKKIDEEKLREIPPEWTPGLCLPHEGGQNGALRLYSSSHSISDDEKRREDDSWKRALHYADSVRKDRSKRRVNQDIQTRYDDDDGGDDDDGDDNYINNTTLSTTHSPGTMSFEKDTYPVVPNGALNLAQTDGIYNPGFVSIDGGNVGKETCV